MHKKGALSLEKLVEFTPEIIMIVIALGVLATLMYIFLVPTKTGPDKDFALIIDGMEAKETQPQFDLTVPLFSEESYDILVVPGGVAGGIPACGGQFCLCMNQIVGGKYKQTCRVFPNVHGPTDCPANQCGPSCVLASQKFEVNQGQSFRMYKTCNAIGFEVV